MELNDLKKTWSRVSSGKELDEEQIKGILGKRTNNLIDRINRNVRIGFIVLFALILLFVVDDFIIAPRLAGGMELNIKMPQWLVLLSVFSNALIISAFIYFVVKYYRVRKLCDITCNLRDTLIRIIEILRIYQRLFYLTLFIFAMALALQFISGMYAGMAYGLEDVGMSLSEISLEKWFLLTGLGLLVLVLSVGGVYLLMRWGFRKLYGKYLHKLKHTLMELDELEA